jgi:hypothetical protein
MFSNNKPTTLTNSKLINTNNNSNNIKTNDSPTKPTELKTNIFLLNQTNQTTSKPINITSTGENNSTTEKLIESKASMLINRFNSAKINIPVSGGLINSEKNLPFDNKNIDPNAKSQEEILEEKRLKREKMRLKLGNSCTKLIAAKKEEKQRDLEAQLNGEGTLKIKSLANLFEGKMGVAFLKAKLGKTSSNSGADNGNDANNNNNLEGNNDSNQIKIQISEKNDNQVIDKKLKKLYEDDVTCEKEIEIMEDNDEDQDYDNEVKDEVICLKKMNINEDTNRIRIMSNNPLMMSIGRKNDNDINKVNTI